MANTRLGIRVFGQDRYTPLSLENLVLRSSFLTILFYGYCSPEETGKEFSGVRQIQKACWVGRVELLACSAIY